MAIIGNIKFEKSTRTDQTQRLGKVTSNPRHPLETKFTELTSLQSKDLCHFFSLSVSVGVSSDLEY